MVLQNGDILLTYGKGGFWPLRRMVLWLTYRAIRAYQKKKWGRNWMATHCRVFLNGRFFEATTPVCCWTEVSELALDKKDWKVARWAGTLDVPAMMAVAERLIGTPYDIGDLVDFGISGLLGWVKGLRIFGDRARKYRVCSTAAAEIVNAGGARLFWRGKPLPPENADPAAFENQPIHAWRIIEGSNDETVPVVVSVVPALVGVVN